MLQITPKIRDRSFNLKKYSVREWMCHGALLTNTPKTPHRHEQDQEASIGNIEQHRNAQVGSGRQVAPAGYISGGTLVRLGKKKAINS